ncbi:MAG: LysM peptidoglycan-binding domain-containing protein [Rhizomicrobium sp.]
MGTLSGGAIVAGTTGKTVAYNSDGSRASAVNAANGTSEAYTYTADGYLAQVTVGGVVRASYALDAMGRVTDQKEYNAAGTSVVYERTAVYNTRSQVTSDQVTSVRSDGTWVTSTAYSYIADSDFDGVYGDHTDRYLGQVTDEIATVTKNGVAQPTTEAAFYYVWRDGALEASESYTPNRAAGGPQPNYNSYTYGQGGLLESVVVGDGRPRTVSFVTNLAGEVLARNEADNNTAAGDPHERHYYFGGIAVGAISNNGTSNVDYAQSIAQHIAVPGTGAFRGGATAATSYADFDQSYDPINGLNVGTAPSRITVQQGDTLEAIAYQVWGDASYWYLLADANGLISDADLQAGMSLIVPDKVANSHNNSSTYRVYDPNEAQGNNSPTVPKPAARHGGACGVFGQILLAVIAIAVTVVTYGAAVGFAAGTLGLGAGSLGSVVVGGALAGAAGSVASQGIGLATGIQKSFDWGGLALAAIGGAVGGALGPDGINAFGSLGKSVGSFGAGVLRGVTGGIVTQGIGVATGLQKSFDWAGVAAAGIGGGVFSAVTANAADLGLGDLGAGGLRFVSGMAGDIANAATRTLIDGSDFGDNIVAALPDVIGQTIGNAMAGGVQQASQPKSLLDLNNGDWTTEGTTGATIHDTPVEVSDLPPPTYAISEDGSSITLPGNFVLGSDGSDTTPSGSRLPDGFNYLPTSQRMDGNYYYTWDEQRTANGVNADGTPNYTGEIGPPATFETSTGDEIGWREIDDAKTGNIYDVFFDATKQQFMGAVTPLAGNAFALADGISSISFPSYSIGHPGTAESFIPVWGSTREAIADYQDQNYAGAGLNIGLAISDGFLVKDIGTGIAKGAWKFGGHSWSTTRTWLRNTGYIQKVGEVWDEGHHWLIPQNGWGKAWPNWLKNQPWNILSLDDPTHLSVHGQGPNAYNLLERLFYGTPRAAKTVLISTTGHIIDANNERGH